MIYLVLTVAVILVKVVAKPLLLLQKPLLLLQKKPPPEPDKSPGPPKLAIKMYLARIISQVRPPKVAAVCVYLPLLC